MIKFDDTYNPLKKFIIGIFFRLFSELLTIDDNALYHVGQCVPLQTIYEDQLVMYQRQLDSENIIVKDEIQICRGESEKEKNGENHKFDSLWGPEVLDKEDHIEFEWLKNNDTNV